jgi:hypothetical protein
MNDLEGIKEGIKEYHFPSEVKDMATAHWGYVESVLRAHGESEEVIKKCGHHYKTAFEHGWKHAAEKLGAIAHSARFDRGY